MRCYDKILAYLSAIQPVFAALIFLTQWPNTLLTISSKKSSFVSTQPFNVNRPNFIPLNGTPTTAFGLMLVSFLCFAIMDTSAKWLVLAAIPSLQVAFLRYFVHFIWVILIYFPKNGMAITRSRNPRLQFLRAFLLFSATAFNFTALKYLPLTTTTAIFFAAPMLVCLLSVPILKEKVGIKRFVAVAVGFVGVLIIVAPWEEQFDYHIFLAVGALFGASGYFIMSRVIAGVDSNSVAQFYCAGVPSLILLPVVLTMWEWPSTGLDWVLLVLIGSLGMFGHSVLTAAHRFAEASVLAPTVYSQIIYITLFSWLIFDTVPNLSTAIGVVIIIASGVYIWNRERALQKQQTTIPAA